MTKTNDLLAADRIRFIRALIRYTLQNSPVDLPADMIYAQMLPEWEGTPLGRREVVASVRAMRREGKLASRRARRARCIMYRLAD